MLGRPGGDGAWARCSTCWRNIRFVAVLIFPVMPSTPARIYEQLGITEEGKKQWASLSAFGGLQSGTWVRKAAPLFPRVEVEKELEALTQDQLAFAKGGGAEEEAPAVPQKPQISIDDFDKLDLRVATVLSCEKVEKSDKLLRFSLSLGAETRTVLSGIAGHYQPEELVGKQVVLLANLAPRKIRGVLSEGMILSAAEAADKALRLLTVEGQIAPGSGIS